MTAASQMLERSAWDEKGRGYLAALNQSICRMLRIVGRMELTQRLSASAPRLELAGADLAELTTELGERMEGLLERAGVELTVRCPARLPARVDAAMVRQLLLELVSNAAKAGKHVTVTLEEKRDTAVFTVVDDGPGVPPERAALLFPGEEDQELPDWRQGGIGISIAQRIARLHGGTLMADCTHSPGLLVSVSIPLDRGRDGTLETPRPRWDGGGFDEALVGLSHLLPAAAFAPVDYE